jgi:hypothetical protein
MGFFVALKERSVRLKGLVCGERGPSAGITPPQDDTERWILEIVPTSSLSRGLHKTI